MSTNSKDLRKQARAAILEVLPEILTKEMAKEITEKVFERVAVLEKHIADRLADMDKRHKEVLSYLVRENSKPFVK